MDSMGVTSIGPPQIATGRLPAIIFPKLDRNQPEASAFAAAIGPIMFDINPEKITINNGSIKKIEVRPPDIDGAGARYKLESTAPPKITISGLIFEGLATKWKCDILLGWCKPERTARLVGKYIPKVTKQWHLFFSWGLPPLGFFYEVTMDSVVVNYERFNPMGIPTRATVSLTMSKEYNVLSSMPTNPTSGGLASRREHTVIQGENLQSIARNYFGSTGAWRPLAEINGIDDASRLRPGQTILIPNPSELPQSGADDE